MKQATLLPLTAALLGLAAHASAAAFTGPGGVASDGGTFGSTTEPIANFTSVNYIDVTMTVDSAGSYNFNQAPGLGGTQNNTGFTWTGFDLTISGNAGGVFINPSAAPLAWESYPAFLLAAFTPVHVVFGDTVASPAPSSSAKRPSSRPSRPRSRSSVWASLGWGWCGGAVAKGGSARLRGAAAGGYGLWWFALRAPLGAASKKSPDSQHRCSLPAIPPAARDGEGSVCFAGAGFTIPCARGFPLRRDQSRERNWRRRHAPATP